MTTTAANLHEIPAQSAPTGAEAVTLYTKPNCVQCTATKRRLEAKGIKYATVDITEDAEALAMLQAKGFLQAPVVMAGAQAWSGFKPAMIDALAS